WQSTVISCSYLFFPTNFPSNASAHKRSSISQCPRECRESLRFPVSSARPLPASPAEFGTHPADDLRAFAYPISLHDQTCRLDRVVRILVPIRLHIRLAYPQRRPSA